MPLNILKAENKYFTPSSLYEGKDQRARIQSQMWFVQILADHTVYGIWTLLQSVIPCPLACELSSFFTVFRILKLRISEAWECHKKAVLLFTSTMCMSREHVIGHDYSEHSLISLVQGWHLFYVGGVSTVMQYVVLWVFTADLMRPYTNIAVCSVWRMNSTRHAPSVSEASQRPSLFLTDNALIFAEQIKLHRKSEPATV